MGLIYLLLILLNLPHHVKNASFNSLSTPLSEPNRWKLTAETATRHYWRRWLLCTSAEPVPQQIGMTQNRTAGYHKPYVSSLHSGLWTVEHWMNTLTLNQLKSSRHLYKDVKCSSEWVTRPFNDTLCEATCDKGLEVRVKTSVHNLCTAAARWGAGFFQ